MESHLIQNKCKDLTELHKGPTGSGLCSSLHHISYHSSHWKHGCRRTGCYSGSVCICYSSACSILPRSILLLLPPNLHLKRRNVLNPVMSPLLPDDGKPHDREVIMSHFVTPCPDLQGVTLTSPSLTLFVGGSHCKNEKGNFPAGFTITPQDEYLKGDTSHQLKQPSKQSSTPLQSALVTRRTNCQYLYQ